MAKEKSLRDVGRKVEAKREHLRTMQYETTPAQRLMRNEMSQPTSIRQVLEEEFGLREEDPQLRQVALEVIREHGDGLRLGAHDWAIVQRMVEAGIKRGASAAGERMGHTAEPGDSGRVAKRAGGQASG